MAPGIVGVGQLTQGAKARCKRCGNPPIFSYCPEGEGGETCLFDLDALIEAEELGFQKGKIAGERDAKLDYAKGRREAIEEMKIRIAAMMDDFGKLTREENEQ